MSDGNEKKKSAPGYLNICNILKLGSGFFLTFASFANGQNLLPQVLKDLGFDRLGFVCVAVIYTSFTFFCFVAPGTLRHCSQRAALVVSSCAYAVFIASGLLPAGCPDCARGGIIAVMIFSSFLVGVGAPFLWVTQGAIMTYNSPQIHLNTYTSVFQIFFQSAFLAGPAIATPLVDHPVLFFAVMACISLAGTAVLATIRAPVLHESIPVQNEEIPSSIRDTLIPVADFIRTDSRAKAIGVYAVFIGVMFNGFPAIALPLFADGTQNAAVLLTALGVGSLIGGLSFGRLSNTLGRRMSMVLGVTLQELAMAALIVVTRPRFLSKIGNDVASVVASLVLGLGNSLNFANLAACISSAVHDKARLGFASQQVFISLATIPSFLLLPGLDRNWITGICSIISAVAALFLLTRPSFFQTLKLAEDMQISSSKDKAIVEDHTQMSIATDMHVKGFGNVQGQIPCELDCHGRNHNSISSI